jgi:excisionase family DNA binding protein
MSDIEIVGHKVWCPNCKQHVELRRVRNAAKLVDVDRRTVYRYIDQGLVYGVKIAGKTYRVCTTCLFRQNTEPDQF